MNIKKIALITASFIMVLSCLLPVKGAATRTVDITIDATKDRKAISPYIFGVNANLMKSNASFQAVRAGGNRYTAYNWENNASNAGVDLNHVSDSYFQHFSPLLMWNDYGSVALYMADVCKKNNAYPLMTLGLAGYVAADKKGEVDETETPPSKRWNKVEFVKGSAYSLKPNLKDNTVYMDEFVYYLVNKLGDSQNGGIRGYSLDNEPSQWSKVHPMLHPDQTTCQEIVEKSIAMATSIKGIDPGAEVFGPALYGYGAYTSFRDAPDWNDVKQDYSWFIDYYLDEMRKAEETAGMRLLDVLDIHYYTEAKGVCGERSCNHYDDEGCVSQRLNATRTLWDDTYRENSWLAGAQYLPLLPSIRESINRYYPGTKIAISEYDFGASDDISGAIAEADALGVFAQNDVYFATLFAREADYQLAAIDLYANFDGNGSGFGNTLVSCESSDIDLSTAYAAVEDGNDDVITLVVTNKSMSEEILANIHLNKAFGYVHLYGIDENTAKVIDMGENDSSTITISDTEAKFTMKPESVSLLVIAKDKFSYKKYTSNGEFSVSDAESKRAEQIIATIEKVGIGVLIAGVVLIVAAKIKSTF